METSGILIGSGVLFGLVGLWDNLILPNVNSLPSSIQNAALNAGINPDLAFIPEPSGFSTNFWYYVAGGLIASGIAAMYGSIPGAILALLLAMFLLYEDYQNNTNSLE